MEDKELWEHLLQNPSLCRITQRLLLTNDVLVVNRGRGPSFQRKRSLITGEFHELTSNLYEVLPHMINLGHVKLSWTKNDQGNLGGFRKFLDALVDIECRLKELDLLLKVPDSLLSRDTTQLQRLQLSYIHNPSYIWSKLDLTTLQKLRLQFQGPQPAILFCEVTYINSMLSNAKSLTHLNLTIEHVASFVKILQSTWVNLENLTIVLRDASVSQLNNPSALTNFLKRHPNLTTLSLPAFAYVTGFPPYMDILPSLISLSYNSPIQVPLGQVLSSPTLRRLRHLTIDKEDPSLFLNEDMCRELTSLETCYIKGSLLVKYGNINQILTNLGTHIPTLQRICLPHITLPLKPNPGAPLEEVLFEALSLLQRFPNLTHLAGVPWAADFSGPRHDRLFQSLYRCHRLKYVISPSLEGGKPICVFRLTRESDNSVERMLIEPVPEMAYRHCHPDTWGGFYQGMEC
ncbi:hypothetical protein Clacol_001190 [Clathrus columnatus]|uniref:Uncharacterized protein n=1 Tax=Clathrus columnatus TaxID=1419009 RepID=A0AAV4ZXU3_9AGAM|nr:hypothetical protein Clacol_001190 [Clathrus columnatus]